MKWPLGNSGATVSLQCTHSHPTRKPYRLYSTVTVSAAPETAPRYLRRPSRSLWTLVLVNPICQGVSNSAQDLMIPPENQGRDGFWLKTVER